MSPSISTSQIVVARSSSPGQLRKSSNLLVETSWSKANLSILQYPTEKSYSFYSARLGDRGRSNKLGMRLDYILMGGSLCDIAFDAYIEDQVFQPLATSYSE